MTDKGNIYIHIIEEGNDYVLSKRLASSVPRLNDEIRISREGKEQYYRVTRVILVYDASENPFERVSIGVILAA